MGVSRLNQEQKDWVIQAYQAGKLNQLQIAAIATVSPRTISRVISEAGLATPVARLQGEALFVMKLLKKYDVMPNELEHVLKWYLKQQQKNVNDSRFSVVA